MKPYYETKLGKLYHGDCLDVMQGRRSKLFDMVLTDPPYGTTACKWDSVIPMEPMWECLKRIVRPNAAIVMTASQPFTSVLISSNVKVFKYEWIWEKSKASNFLQARYMPLKAHENVVVFCNKGKPTFNHQWTYGEPYNALQRVSGTKGGSNTDVYNDVPNPKFREVREDGRRNPRTVQYFKTAEGEGKFHPTQKPVPLFEYLIKTYTNEHETVLDLAMGSGTTAIACENLNRKWVGIEKEEKYCEIAAKRITDNSTLF